MKGWCLPEMNECLVQQESESQKKIYVHDHADVCENVHVPRHPSDTQGTAAKRNQQLQKAPPENFLMMTEIDRAECAAN